MLLSLFALYFNNKGNCISVKAASFLSMGSFSNIIPGSKRKSSRSFRFLSAVNRIFNPSGKSCEVSNWLNPNITPKFHNSSSAPLRLSDGLNFFWPCRVRLHRRVKSSTRVSLFLCIVNTGGTEGLPLKVRGAKSYVF
ncbi:MAG: hypothetical protein RLZZ242_272 [Bacteroidota bacterium]